MSHLKLISACLAIALLLSLPLRGGEASFAVKAGFSNNIPSVGAPDRTFDLFIPAAYMKDTARAFPILFISSPGGTPDVKKYSAWAERQGVIVVGFNSSRNGPTDNNVQAQETALKTVEPALRLHACLRFAAGMSGGAQASWVLATRYPNAFAGLLMMGQCGFDNLPPKHVAVAYIHGDKEPNYQFISSAHDRLKKAGNPLQRLIIPGGHVEANMDEQAKYLDWMLELGRLTHPKLSPEDKALAKKDIQSRLSAAAAAGDPKALENLLALPTVAAWPENKPHFSTWAKITLESAAKITDPIEKHERLGHVTASPWAAQVDAATRSAIDKELAELRKNAAVKTEYEADTAYSRTVTMEEQAGAKKAQIQAARQAYEAIAQRYPNTRSGKKAAESAKRLEGGK